MNYKSQVLLGAIILFLGSGAAYSKPCEKCPSKKATQCLTNMKACLSVFNRCGQTANTPQEEDECFANWEKCIIDAERRSGCPITRQSSTQK